MRGDGSEKGRIMQAFGEWGITNTTFVPLVDVENLVTSLQEATVHIVPQAVDVANYALPSKLFSIMSAGRPYVCVAERGSPLDDLTQCSQAGICVPPGNENALFEAVTGLLDDMTQLRVKGENGRSFVARRMNKESIMRRYFSVISEVSI
jgi:colanic acid biosynthesis glycosyl transferase WcaI